MKKEKESELLPIQRYSTQEKKVMENYSKDYVKFISKAKTVTKAVDYFLGELKKLKAKEIDSVKKWNGKDVLYAVNRGKSVIMAFGGKKGIKDGINFFVAHIDSPRIDLKPKFFKEQNGILTIDTQYYGGIKKYHWVAMPVELQGFVITKDMKKVYIEGIYLSIPDLAPHVDRSASKKISEKFNGEKLDLIAGLHKDKPKKKDEKTTVKDHVLKILEKQFGIKEEDLHAAELSLVPAWDAMEVGIDKSMIGAYGHDDRICCYQCFTAARDAKHDKVTVVYLVDREEIGSIGVTAMRSAFFKQFLYKLLEKSGVNPTEPELLNIMEKSFAVSADVTTIYDPVNPEAFDAEFSYKAGLGVCLEKYIGSGGKYSTTELDALTTRKLINIFEKKKVAYQLGEFAKVDIGGGGTEAMYLADLNIDVVDMGPGLWSMHSPFEVVAKVDLYETYKAYKALMEESVK